MSSSTTLSAGVGAAVAGIGEEIAVNTQYLQRDTNEIETALKNIRAKQQEMFDEINALNAMWEGEAKEAFMLQFNQDRELLNQNCENIQALIDSMRFAEKEYVRCEADVRSLIDSVRV